MPTQPTAVWSMARLDPVINPREAMASMIRVALPPNVTYPQGQLLGELTATPGTYKAYVPGVAATDGSQNPTVILQYPCATDVNGNVTNMGEWGFAEPTAPAFTQGYFRAQELTGLDVPAVEKMNGLLTEGSVTTGLFKF